MERKVRPITASTSEIVANNVKNTMRQLGISHSQLADVMNVSRGTLYNRFLNPDEFQIGELEKLSRFARNHGYRKVNTASFFQKQNGGAVC